jgi:hypothetical protein
MGGDLRYSASQIRGHIRAGEAEQAKQAVSHD